jgi:hydrogenase maturation protease
MSPSHILIAGIGNIFLGDDAFGCEVAQRLTKRQLPAGVCVTDFGIRGLDLAYSLLNEQEMVILVDAVARGGPPGTVYLIEPDISALLSDDSAPQIDAHGMHPEKVLRHAAYLGAKFGRIFLVGCEPRPFNPEDEVQIDLSPPVRAGVDEAIDLVESLISDFVNNRDLSVAAYGRARSSLTKERQNENH